jgi:DNA-binding MarR family transcriptional regulator
LDIPGQKLSMAVWASMSPNSTAFSAQSMNAQVHRRRKIRRMADQPWLSDAQQRVWRQYLYLNRRLQERIERDMQQQSGMPLAYYLILAMLSEAPQHSLRMNQLAEIVEASQSRTSHAVARLEEKGWVRRDRSAEDRRGQVAVLTDAGWTRVQQLAPGHADTVRSTMFDGLDDRDLTELSRLFDKISTHLGNRDAPTV